MIVVCIHATGEVKGEFPETIKGYKQALDFCWSLPCVEDGRYAIDAPEGYAEVFAEMASDAKAAGL